MKGRYAFTLAEVLITLGIIGIIAVLTIPMVTAHYQKKALEAAAAKGYSVVNNLISRAEADYGSVRDWSEWDENRHVNPDGSQTAIRDVLMKYLNGAIFYKNENTDSPTVKAMCYEEGLNYKKYKWLSGNVEINDPLSGRISSLQLEDGMCIGFRSLRSGENDDALQWIIMDVNGRMNKPNTAGKDLFFYYLLKNGKIVPFGYNWTKEQLVDPYKNNSCTKELNRNGGAACTAKIMADGWKIKKDYPW